MSNNEVAGAPEEIRTPDPQIRSLVLYPAELRALVRLSRISPVRNGRIAIVLSAAWQGWAAPVPAGIAPRAAAKFRRARARRAVRRARPRGRE